MASPLRILMVNHLPLDRRLGGSAVQMYLADEFRRQGHVVDTYSLDDAFPDPPRTRVGSLLRRPFWAVAPKAIKRVAHRYDVIDAHQGDLPVPKRKLGFEGVLSARSVGLVPFYHEFEMGIPERWSDQTLGHPVSAALRRRRSVARVRAVHESFRCADVVNVCNRDELRYVTETLSLDGKAVCLPLGLPDDLVGALGRADRDAAARLGDQEVLAIGTWDLRKGRRDWPAIVDRVLARHPGARFHFIGTSVDRDAVLAEFSAGARGAIRVTARYGPGEMTELLRSGTVNALPTYIEGFGLGVLEGLAAGIPSVVYDVPGPRETVGRIDPGAMVPVGDHAAFAAALGERLTWPEARYAEVAQQGRELAEEHRWSAIADRTLEVYRERLDDLRSA